MLKEEKKNLVKLILGNISYLTQYIQNVFIPHVINVKNDPLDSSHPTFSIASLQNLGCFSH